MENDPELEAIQARYLAEVEALRQRRAAAVAPVVQQTLPVPDPRIKQQEKEARKQSKRAARKAKKERTQQNRVEILRNRREQIAEERRLAKEREDRILQQRRQQFNERVEKIRLERERVERERLERERVERERLERERLVPSIWLYVYVASDVPPTLQFSNTQNIMNPTFARLITADIANNLYQLAGGNIVDLTTNKPIRRILKSLTNKGASKSGMFEIVSDRWVPSQPLVLSEPATVNVVENDVLDHRLGTTERFPYLYFDNPQPQKHENCIINVLLHKYEGSISRNKILTWFMSGTTIRNLKAFFKKYNISYRIYGITGKILYEAVGDTKNRPAIALMVHNNHACVYTLDMTKGTPNFKPSKDHTVKGFMNTKFNEKFDKPLPKVLLTPGLNVNYPNFTFVAEKSCVVKSVMYENNEYAKDTKVEGYDADKAFYSATMKCPPDTKIPIFSIADKIEEYNGGDIIHEALYFLSDVGLWRSSMPWQQTNVMLGFRVQYELNAARLLPEEITHVKIPTYTTTCRVLQDTLVTEKAGFALYNGLLGKITKKSAYITMICNDASHVLLIYMHPDAESRKIEGTPNSPQEWEVKIPTRREEHLYNNNRNYYSFVVEICNFYVIEKMDKARRMCPRLTLIKLWVDYIAFDATSNDEYPLTELESATLHQYAWDFVKMFLVDDTKFTFKPQSSKIRGFTPRFSYVDPVKLSEEIAKELPFPTLQHVAGMGGTGKSYVVKKDYDYDHACAFTNIAARNIEGVTLHSLLLLSRMNEVYKYARRYKDKTLWIDECNMVPGWIWGVLYALAIRYKIQYIISGDKRQNIPIGEHIDHDYLLGSPGLVLTENHRFSGKLLEINTKLSEGIKLESSDYKDLMRTKFDPSIDVHFTLSHRYKDEINNTILKERNLQFFPPSTGLRVTVHEGYSSYDLCKGSVYSVGGTLGGHVILYELFPRKRTISIPDHIYGRYFTVGYAATLDSCESRTIDEPMAVYEINKVLKLPNAGRRLYVAFGRPTDIQFVNLYFDHPEGLCYPAPAHNAVTCKDILEINNSSRGPRSLFEVNQRKVYGTLTF